MPIDHFGEQVAEHFDRRYARLEVAAVVDPMVDFLADLGGGGAALEWALEPAGSLFHSPLAAYGYTGLICRRRWLHGSAPSPVLNGLRRPWGTWPPQL